MGEILSANSIEGVVRKDVPERVISRLPIYLQTVETIAATGQSTISSEVLAARSGVSSSILRKDLSQLGRSGRRGVGYSCEDLASTLRTFLGLDRARSVAIIGAGRLGSALADYAGFKRRGLSLTAIFDTDEAKIGTVIGTLPVSDLTELPTWPEDIDLVVMAVPASAAPAAAHIAAEAGVRGILNFAPTVLDAPDSVRVHQVDLASELQVLAYYSALDSAPLNPGFEEHRN
ncbi:MAG: redox-sensing transcriptional repressor Rex [Brevibacterium sp.]|nr:redox-sensing transcriptional repressor Rex [Brevibacterium sp.]MDN5908136.1 redox-sensing transcriptional repressor Rex [Brevibacterium sp.]MDN6124288.1 redox-sensing transcriptional repressor Rex [Brevibacterium sp.]MDN6157893.1 redox-sensing transcriptional repressor Rex [Brevibacterium sp.]MDN6175023.1 redox-sensing transcriptional repressor Rex [Brevibacterium sp.]